ncbi:long-chain fatty acid--CoA ligase [bacterium]|nr:long-chain fatty acid--CoA ligase [bacterium]
MTAWIDRYDAQPRQRPAVFWRGCWLSYGELAQRASALATWLAAQGVGRGDAVSILANNHIAHLDLIAAADWLGACYAPLNTRLSAAEQAQILAVIKPKVVLVGAGCKPLLPDSTPAPVALDAYERLLADVGSGRPPADDRAPERIAMLLLTGGSTGTPKAAMIPRRQIDANIDNTVAAWGLEPDDCVVQASPAFHAGINVLATPLLAIGGRVVLMDGFDAGAYLAAVATHRASALFMVPTMYRMLADHPDFQSADLHAVRFAISGGAACDEALRQRFAERGIGFRQGYGLTEAGVNCFAISADEAANQPQSVGRPMLNTQAVLRDADGTPVALGEVGELTLAGPHVFAGYLGNQAETAKALRDGWLWTGDLARQDTQGLFTIVGRRKEMFISGGENVFPAEVEAAIATHPQVAEVAVFGVPHPHWGEVGVAAIAPAGLGHGALKAHLQPQLAGYKIPHHVLAMDALPKTGAGKIDKPALKARAITSFALDDQHVDSKSAA